jgi:hypothetical protein
METRGRRRRDEDETGTAETGDSMLATDANDEVFYLNNLNELNFHIFIFNVYMHMYMLASIDTHMHKYAHLFIHI